MGKNLLSSLSSIPQRLLVKENFAARDSIETLYKVAN